MKSRSLFDSFGTRLGEVTRHLDVTELALSGRAYRVVAGGQPAHGSRSGQAQRYNAREAQMKLDSALRDALGRLILLGIVC